MGSAATLAIRLTSVAPAAADWREGFGTFNIGLLGGENEADRLRRYDCMQSLVEDLLGVPVELFPAADYAGVMQGLLAGQLHTAGLGASAYAGIYLQDAGSGRTGADPRPAWMTVLVIIPSCMCAVTADIMTLEDMEGRSLAYADAEFDLWLLVAEAARCAMNGHQSMKSISRQTGFRWRA